MEKSIGASKLLVFWLAAAVSVGTLASFGYSYLRDNELRFARLEAKYERTEQRASGHETTTLEWKDRIINNEQQIRKIATNALYRPDPFTGTDGAKLERRIDTVERSLEKMNYMEQRINALHEEFRENEAYYRRQILPLFEQSNALQQHRIQQGMK